MARCQRPTLVIMNPAVAPTLCSNAIGRSQAWQSQEEGLQTGVQCASRKAGRVLT